MTAAWPEDVNQDVVRTGYQWAPQDNVDRFSPDSGPAIGQLKSNTETEIVGPFHQFFTVVEFETLKTWRRDVLEQGTLPFTRLHPDAGTLCTFVFAEDGFRLVDLLPLERKVRFILERIA